MTSAPEASGAGSGWVSGGEPERGMLELRFPRRERDRELAEHLRVGVEGVAGVVPHLVRQSRPRRR